MPMSRERALRKEEQESAALRLHMKGLTVREIAAELGVSSGTASNRVRAALDNMRPHADYDSYRSRMLAELNLGREELMRGLLDADLPYSHKVRGLEAVVKVQERESRLLGLDLVPTPYEIVRDMSDEDLMNVIAGWETDLAAD